MSKRKAESKTEVKMMGTEGTMRQRKKQALSERLRFVETLENVIEDRGAFFEKLDENRNHEEYDVHTMGVYESSRKEEIQTRLIRVWRCLLGEVTSSTLQLMRDDKKENLHILRQLSSSLLLPIAEEFQAFFVDMTTYGHLDAPITADGVKFICAGAMLKSLATTL